jgi:hypothetical protein
MKKKELPEVGVAKSRIKVLEASLLKFSVSMDASSIVDSLSPLAAQKELKVLKRHVACVEKKEV